MLAAVSTTWPCLGAASHVAGDVVWHTDMGTASAPASVAEVDGWFSYRGLEWLQTGLSVGTAELAAWMGVPKSEINKLGRLANSESGVRHASSSGQRIRAGFNTVSWVSGLIDAINGARAKLEPGFQPTAPEAVAQIVARA